MYSYTLASTSAGCGTDYNWYRTGELPTEKNVEVPLEMCRNGIGDACDRNVKARTMLCDDGSYIFFLPYVLGCPEAYCIESRDNKTSKVNDEPPNITETKIVLETATAFRDGRNVLEFYCDFATAPNTSLFYMATYAITTGQLVTNELYVSERAQYQNKTQFRERVKMTETDLQQKIARPLGIHMECYIEASYQAASAKSNQVVSKPKFIGIECLNKENLTLDSKSPLHLQFRPTIPFGCKNGGPTCELNIELYTPTPTQCKLPEPVSKMSNLIRRRTSCGLVISNDIKKTYNLTVHNLPGSLRNTGNMRLKFTLFLRTIENYHNHPFFGGYQLDPITVSINDDKPPKLLGAQCYSTTDPRMRTFDRRYYSLQERGTFILYKSNSLEQEMKTTACSPGSSVYCNCGVAVRAGRDLYVLDLCNNNRIKTGMFRVCDHGLMVKELSAGIGSETLVLPSGAQVNIIIRSIHLHIYISPSANDYLDTDGLCGSFDGDSANDDVLNFKKWRVDNNRKHLDLFNWKNDARLPEWSEDTFLCKCPQLKNRFETRVECHSESQKTCDPDSKTRGTGSMLRKVRRCMTTTSITKRDGTKHFKMVHDFYRSTKTAFVSKLEKRQTKTPEFLSKRSAEIPYTEETAYTDCMKVLNTTAFQMCSDIPGLNFTSFITHCVLDAVDSNSMYWTQSYLEGIKSKCVYEIKAEQPLPPEEYEGLTIEINGTTTTFENITENNITLPKIETIPEFSEENLKAIESVVCLNECSNQGNCVNGTCECNEPFIGSDCSIDSSLPPEMLGIPDEGMCDYQQRPCNIIYIYADNIADTGFMCRLTPFEVTSSEVTYQHEKTIEIPGIINGFSEVACDIADHRAKRSATMDFPNEIIAIGFRVGLSNNNKTYSEEDSVVHFDSDCVQCEKHAGNVACEELPGFCVSNGRCYEVNETHQCLKCSRKSDETHFWKPDCENNTVTLKPGIETVPTSGDDTWLILAIVSSVIGVLILVVGAVVVKRCKRRQENVDIQSKNAKDGVNIPLCELK
ncbi:uncharacterized protein LOC128240345 isoform X2 [Mya arenaria]|uniref:uncharacterized protein LOC128240345 isoform X2 n=1 Tax=Mya arenaria TaxID=6604 RepID=UPI0022E3B112|nr:uncharacterized protein LOC128240345 isoform X2 [Mya arenaria]